MRKLISIVISVLLAACCLSCISSAKWVEYDTESISKCAVMIKRVRLNSSGSISITVTVQNFSDSDICSFCLVDNEKSSEVSFGAYSFDLTGMLKNKEIPQGKSKNFRINISSKKVPKSITETDLLEYEYKLAYTYNTDNFVHLGCVSVRTAHFEVLEGEVTDEAYCS